MNKKIDLHLIHKYLSEECSLPERKKVDDWLKADPRNFEYFKEIKKIWEVPPAKVDSANAWLEVSRSAGVKPEKRMTRHRSIFAGRTKDYSMYLRVAAAILITVAVSFFLFDTFNKTADTSLASNMREVSTDIGQTKTLQFSDGTEVSLNAVSSLRYPEQFDSRLVEVFLEGEAYFQVAKNRNRKFIVHAGEVSVQVLGTGFNVMAWPEEDSIEVAVKNGNVSVNSGSEAEKVILHKGQKSYVKRGQAPSSPQQMHDENFILWMEGLLIFDETPLQDVIRNLERRYDVDFEVKDLSILSTTLTGEFSEESLDEMLEILALSMGIDYKKSGNIVTFFKPDNKK
ncbi:MAG: FecR domain-containing protein [Balneolaceae bacterium]